MPSLALLAVALCSCSSSKAPTTLAPATIEHAIARSILREHGVVVSVSCPQSIPERDRYQFTCDAHLGAGTYPVTVTETSSNGSVRYGSQQPFTLLDVAKVRSAIAASIAKQRGLRASVACPADVLQTEGLTFICVATVKGLAKLYPFRVTEIDAHGHVRYVGERGVVPTHTG